MPLTLTTGPNDSFDACFIYKPSDNHNEAPVNDGPPSKKRKTGHGKAKAPGPVIETQQFPVLLQGKESSSCSRARAAVFTQLWSKKEEQLENVLENANAELRDKIVDFVCSQPDQGSTDKRIPTGLINAGLASSATGSTFDAVARHMRGIKGRELIRVHSSECHNLKAVLKTVIQRVTAAPLHGQDVDEEVLESKGGRRHLNYDLQALYDSVKRRGGGRCVLFFQNSEALDPYVLADLVNVLSSWQDRLPFILLFEIAVSADLFQEMLPQSTVRQLDGASFTSKSASEVLDMLFCAATMGGPQDLMYIGPAASRILLDRQTEHIASAKDFLSSLKYMYMMHFFDNPMSWLCIKHAPCDFQPEHADHIKGLRSFSDYTDQLLSSGNKTEVQRLRKNPDHLFKTIPDLVRATRAALWDIQHALEVLMVVNEFALRRASLTYSTLYIKALSGELSDSAIVRELLTAVRKLPSDEMLPLLERLEGIPILPDVEITSHLNSLRTTIKKASAPLRSSYDDRNEVVHTTVVAHKVVLNKAKAKLSNEETTYSKLVEQVEHTLSSCLNTKLVSPTDLPLSEVFIYNGKNAVREAFGAAPRAVVERALFHPVDYLACSCCNYAELTLNPSLPATALVYVLYCEAGALINVQDLWGAYRSTVAEDWKPLQDEVEEERREEDALALFHRALAELRHLGMIRPSRKKADHLMKLRWRGL